MGNEIVIVSKLNEERLVALDDIIFGQLSGDCYIPLINSKGSGIASAVLLGLIELNIETVHSFIFPKDCRIASYLKGRNPELYKKMMFYF